MCINSDAIIAFRVDSRIVGFECISLKEMDRAAGDRQNLICHHEGLQDGVFVYCDRCDKFLGRY